MCDDIQVIEVLALNACENLLVNWGLPELIPAINEKSVDIEALKYFTLEDINTLIPEDQLGLRSKFRQKLFEWRYEQGYATPLADTLSVNSVSTWMSTSSANIILNEPLNADVETISSSSTIFDLKSILNSSLSGKDLLGKKTLNGKDRRCIAGIICEYWLNSNIIPKQNNYKDAAAQIVNIFGNEKKDLYIGNGATRGLLVQKLYSLSKKYRTSGLIKSRYKSIGRENSLFKEAGPSAKDNIPGEESAITQNELNDFEWLKNNKTPEQIVTEKWNATYMLRQKHFKENVDLFEEWPILKQRIGLQLIELDFDRKNPNKNAILFSKWEEFANKVQPIYLQEIKDPANKLLFKKLETVDLSFDCRNYILVLLLNAVLIPTVIKKGKESWKPTITDGQQAFAIHVTNIKNVPSEITKKRKKTLQKGGTLQPVIVVVGETIEKIDTFYIYFNEIFYECENFLKSLSISFQIHQVLNIEYAKECLHVWHFIESYFFEFEVSGKKTNTLISFCSSLNN